MTNKTNLERDLLAADNAADKQLLRLLDKAKGDDRQRTEDAAKSNDLPSSGKTSATGNDVGTDTPARSKRPHAPKIRKVGQDSVAALPKPVNWTQSTATLNTRIPPEMANLLDDLVYTRKREARGTTAALNKQSVVIEAIEDLLRKYRLVS